MAPKAKGCSFFEPLTNVSYLYDGTQEGLLSAVFESYERHEIPNGIFAEFEYQPRLDESSYFVETSMERSCRVGACVERIAGKKALIAVLRAAASESPERGMVVYEFVRYAIESNRTECSRSKILDDLTNPALSNLSRISRRVANEEEKMRQFVRFRHLESGIWFAECNPNASVVPFVMPHFAARFNVQPFIIYDARHKIAGVYDGHDWCIVRDSIVDVPKRAEGDEYAEALWQRFYDSVTIEARYNPELRRSFMPMRLWRDLPEMLPRKSGLVGTTRETL